MKANLRLLPLAVLCIQHVWIASAFHPSSLKKPSSPSVILRNRLVGRSTYHCLHVNGDPTIDELSKYTLGMSNLIYTFAELRRQILINRPRPPKRQKNIVREELIVTQKGAQIPLGQEDKFRYRYLKYDVTADAIREFIALNPKLLPDLTGQLEQSLGTSAQGSSRDNIVITEFDDKCSEGRIPRSARVCNRHK